MCIIMHISGKNQEAQDINRRGKKMGRKENAEELIRQFGEDILDSYGMSIEKQCMQHGSVSVYDHSLMVAALCVKIAVWCGLT